MPVMNIKSLENILGAFIGKGKGKKADNITTFLQISSIFLGFTTLTKITKYEV